MALRLHFDPYADTALDKGVNFPVFECDLCGEPIAEIKKGVCLIANDASLPGAVTDLLLAHQGDCHTDLERRANRTGWLPLEQLLVQLANNMRAQYLLDSKYRAE